MSIDGMNGEVLRIKQAAMSDGVKTWLECAKKFREGMIVQSYNHKGEEAVRAWGVIMGIDMVLMLDKIMEKQANAAA